MALWEHCAVYHPDMQCIPNIVKCDSFEESSEQVGGYVIGKVLGEGQFATVKMCRKRLLRPSSAGTVLASVAKGGM